MRRSKKEETARCRLGEKRKETRCERCCRRRWSWRDRGGGEMKGKKDGRKTKSRGILKRKDKRVKVDSGRIK